MGHSPERSGDLRTSDGAKGYRILKDLPVAEPKTFGKWKRLALTMERGDAVELETLNQGVAFRVAAMRLGFKVTIRKIEEKKYMVWLK